MQLFLDPVNGFELAMIVSMISYFLFGCVYLLSILLITCFVIGIIFSIGNSIKALIIQDHKKDRQKVVATHV